MLLPPAQVAQEQQGHMAEKLQEAQARCSDALLEREDLQGQVSATWLCRSWLAGGLARAQRC